MTSVRPLRRRARRGRGDDLRAEIVAATKELLAESESSAAVSIRAVADAVGVTSPSIYLHFADKDALLEAVCVDVFAELDAAGQEAMRGVDDPLEMLCVYGVAYVKFALEHPEHYRLATMERHTAEDGASHLDMVLAESAFDHLVAAVRGCIDAGFFAADDDAVEVALEMWSAAHGIAALMITKPFLPWGDKLAFAERILASAAVGRATLDLHGGAMTPKAAQAFIRAIAGHRA